MEGVVIVGFILIVVVLLVSVLRRDAQPSGQGTPGLTLGQDRKSSAADHDHASHGGRDHGRDHGGGHGGGSYGAGGYHGGDSNGL